MFKILTKKEYNKLTAKPQDREGKLVDYKHIYTDKEDNKWFSCPIESLHQTRRIYLQSVMNQMAMGLDLEKLQEYGFKILDSAKASDYKQITLTVSNMLAKANNIGTPKLLYDGALITVFMEGEPWAYSEQWIEKKKQLWVNDADARFFFMASFLNTTSSLSDISVDDLIQWAAQESELSPSSIHSSTQANS